MSLAPGTRLGAYEITAPLGAGGMGEVYRGRDTRLDRDVAIKVLPESFASDPDRIARFQREAKTLASLNHPHIGAIYGLEESNGVKALVLELVEGPTLADRIAQGPIPVDEALPIGRQIAEALEASHELGIIHRDLKPANIKLKFDGTLKVLDFGLAKAVEPSSSVRPDLSASPTITSPAMTMGGVILGTAAYMSPEQAKGTIIDKRADIWAFGCVLYEMLTGKRPFDGVDLAEVLAEVIKGSPDWSALPVAVPASIRALLRRCLTKDPKQRLRDIGDASFAMEVASQPTATGRQGTESPRRALFAALAVGLTLGGAAVWSLTRQSELSKPQVRQLVMNLPGSTPSFSGLAISPDGRRVVFAATSDVTPRLFTRRLDEADARPLAGAEFGRSPFFSPDGTWIAFFSDAGQGGGTAKLWKVAIHGGAAQELCDAPFPTGGVWGEDGTIIFASGATPSASELFRVSDRGGKPQGITKAVPGRIRRGWPHLLQGGRAVLFSVFENGAARLEVLTLSTGESRTVVDQGYFGRYIQTGHLVFIKDGNVHAVPFDEARLAVTGSPVQLINDVHTIMPVGATGLDVSPEGTLIYHPGEIMEGGSLTRGTVVLVTRDGRGGSIPQSRGIEGWPRLSPDDSQLAVMSGVFPAGGNNDLWIYDLNRGTQEKFTTSTDEESFPLWSPDGTQITYLYSKSEAGDLYSQSLDTRGAATPLLLSDLRKTPTSWTRDGRVLTFYEIHPESQRDIWTLAVGGKPQPFIVTPFNELAGTFSPDGKWMAYASNESGEMQVYVQPYPGPGRRTPISSDGGEGPVWSRDGRELFYFKRQGSWAGQLMSVDVQFTPTFKAGTPRMLFSGPYVPQANGNPNYDAFRDGQRFVMIQQPNATEENDRPLVIVLNWFEELKRLVPVN